MEPKMIELHSEADTVEIARALAALIQEFRHNSIKIYLSGDLGAGKTTFSKYFLTALGVNETIKSPTYTIIESYQAGDIAVDHIDLYRIHEEDLYDLGFLEDDHKVWLIEWPEKGGDSLPAPDLLLSLERDEFLTMHLLPETELGQQVLSALNV